MGRLSLIILALVAAQARAQDGGIALPHAEPVETDFPEGAPRKIAKDWNEYDFALLTFRWGINTLIDMGTALQDDDSRAQLDAQHGLKLRDFRFSLSGRLKTKREITYTMGLMYDGPSNTWFPRETGIQIAFPELLGAVFFGRQKVGVSLTKIMVGYSVWTMERMPINDASVPILADGIKWLGELPSHRANWNLAYYRNVLEKSPSTGFFTDSVAARFAVLPMLPEKEGALLHLALGYQWGRFSDGEARLRSRPESFTAGYFLDTGDFPANIGHLFVAEAYYRKNAWLVGSEYFFNQVRSTQTGHPFFHGGEVFGSWLVTGETRGYKDLGGKLDFVHPARSAFDGGPGAVEAVLHLSYSDFDDGSIEGGRFVRLTPELNWILDDLVTLRVNYGLGVLDRFGLRGLTHFFQARVQIQIN